MTETVRKVTRGKRDSDGKQKRAKKHNRERKQGAPSSSDSPQSPRQLAIDLSSSDSEENAAALAVRKDRLAKELRELTDCRGRFGDLVWPGDTQAAGICLRAGQYKLDTIKQMRDNKRAFRFNDIRKQPAKSPQRKRRA